MLTHLNQLVLQLTDEQIVTCVYALFDPADGSLLLANAGHPPAVVIATDGTVGDRTHGARPAAWASPRRCTASTRCTSPTATRCCSTPTGWSRTGNVRPTRASPSCARCSTAGGQRASSDPRGPARPAARQPDPRREHDDDVAMLLVRTTDGSVSGGPYDVVVVGAGPNGLAAAITMAARGLSVAAVRGRATRWAAAAVRRR